MRLIRSLRLISISFIIGLSACAGPQTPEADHGTLSELSAVEGEAELCEHEVPGEVCTRCNPELEASFRAVGDWCGPHSVPESQCHPCHPDLNFDPLPEVAAGADIEELSDEEALAGLDTHAVEGKVTVFEFAAPWCASCRNLEAHLRSRLADEPRLAVRRITVHSWDSPIAAQYLTEATAMPFVIVYGPDGNESGRLADFEPADVDGLIAGALGDGAASQAEDESDCDCPD